MVKITASGDILWEKTMGGSGMDIAFSIKQTSDNGYIIAGVSRSDDGDVTENHGGTDYWVVKLFPDNLGVDEFSGRVSVYPNPVTSSLNITANEPVQSVRVFNTLGQEVMAVSHFETTSQLDMSGLPPSLYFVEVATEHTKETFKIVVR